MATRNQILKLYTDKASLYERFFVDLLGWGKELEAFFRASTYLHPNAKILDAGCGTGPVTRILYQLARQNGYTGIQIYAFDLTPKMLEILSHWIARHGASEIEWRQADVLDAQSLPPHWNEYDLIVSAAMLEYLPRDKVNSALVNLKHLLRKGGKLLVFVTKRNAITQWLAGKWWETNLYAEDEMQSYLQEAGFHHIERRCLSAGWSRSIMAIEAEG